MVRFQFTTWLRAAEPEPAAGQVIIIIIDVFLFYKCQLGWWVGDEQLLLSPLLSSAQPQEGGPALAKQQVSAPR